MFIYKLRGCAKCPSPIPQPTSHIPHTRIGIRLGLCTHSNRLDRRSILHANAPLRAGSRGATSCRLTSRARPSNEGGRGSEIGGIGLLGMCVCVVCFGLGLDWALSGRLVVALGSRSRLSCLIPKADPTTRRKKKTTTLFSFLSLPPPLSAAPPPKLLLVIPDFLVFI